MEDKIFIPDAISTGDLLQVIEQRKTEDFLKKAFSEVFEDEEFAEFCESLLDDEIKKQVENDFNHKNNPVAQLLEYINSEPDDKEFDSIIVKVGNTHHVIPIYEIISRIFQYKEKGHNVNENILNLASKSVKDLTEEEQEEIFEYFSTESDFTDFCIEQRRKRKN